MLGAVATAAVIHLLKIILKQKKIVFMKKWFNINFLYLAGAVIGAIAGYLYWQQIGCISGTCAITSKPINSTLYGAVMGALLFGLFKKTNKKKILQEEEKLQP